MSLMRRVWIFFLVFLFCAGLQAQDFWSHSQKLFQQGETSNKLLVIQFHEATLPVFVQNQVMLQGKVFFLQSSKNQKLSPLVQSRSLRTKSSLKRYIAVEFRNGLSEEKGIKLLEQLKKNPSVSLAYFEPKWKTASVLKNNIQVTPESCVPNSDIPDFEELQFHLNPLPEGIDSHRLQTFSGGKGEGIRVIDIEQGWNTNHQDFNNPFFSNLLNEESHHGTAVWGFVAAKDDGVGVTGVAPGVDFGVSSVLWEGNFDDYVPNLVSALEKAMDQLEKGDVIIIEQQAPGPERSKLAPVEYWPAVFDIIKAATDKGIHVVAAAGNGNSNLDHRSYDRAFDKRKRDSGAILVGAAGPPGRPNHLRRKSFSNYGKRVGSFAYGERVVTTGYGGLFGSCEDQYYTDGFGGTSSATPIVAGLVAALSGIQKAKGEDMSPKELRKLLERHGLRQRDNDRKNIGRFPDTKKILRKIQ